MKILILVLALSLTATSDLAFAGILDKATSVSCRHIGATSAAQLEITNMDLKTQSAQGDLKVYNDDQSLRLQKQVLLRFFEVSGQAFIGNVEDATYEFGVRIFAEHNSSAGNSFFIGGKRDADKEEILGICSLNRESSH